MRKAYDLCVKVRSYTDKNGNNKNSYKRIGSLMMNDRNEPFILLDPYYNYAEFPRNADSENLTVSMFKSDKENQSSQPQQQQPQNNLYQQPQYPQWNGQEFNSEPQNNQQYSQNQIPF